MAWEDHVGNSTEIRKDIILGRYLLTSLGLSLYFSDNVITVYNESFEGCTAPM